MGPLKRRSRWKIGQHVGLERQRSWKSSGGKNFTTAVQLGKAWAAATAGADQADDASAVAITDPVSPVQPEAARVEAADGRGDLVRGEDFTSGVGRAFKPARRRKEAR